MPNTTVDPYATTPPPAPYATKRAGNSSEQVLGLYQSNLGRSASSDEIAGHIKNVGGGGYLSDAQYEQINAGMKAAPEYTQYTGQRPTVGAGAYIPDITLGTQLGADPMTAQRRAAGPAANETTNAGMQGLIRERLMGLMNQPGPTMQDPNIAAQTSAFNAAQNKASARQVNANAEAFGAGGLESSGARLAADRGVIEQQGLNEGTFAANAMQSELTARRDQLQQALTLASATNDQDLARRLQQELANTQAAIQREGLAQTGRLGDADLALRGKQGTAANNINLLGLMQQGRQFNDSMGFNLAGLESTLNNQAVRTLLGL
jgi:hypothetical protein